MITCSYKTDDEYTRNNYDYLSILGVQIDKYLKRVVVTSIIGIDAILSDYQVSVSV